jgi:hypothetical protein
MRAEEVRGEEREKEREEREASAEKKIDICSPAEESEPRFKTFTDRRRKRWIKSRSIRSDLPKVRTVSMKGRERKKNEEGGCVM